MFSRLYHLILLTILAMALLRPAHHILAQQSERCFPETGYCISGRIRTFWERNGGLPAFGFPLKGYQ